LIGLALLVGASSAACAEPPRAPVEAPIARRERPRLPLRFVLVTVDGTRWQEIFHGADPALAPPGVAEAVSAEALTPNLHRLMRRGLALGDLASGSRFLASGPNFVSLPGYTEILTGKPSPCQENDCRLPVAETLPDAFRESGLAADEIVVLASWERIGDVAAEEPRGLVVSAGRRLRVPRDLLVASDDVGLRQLFETSSHASPAPGGGTYRPDLYTRALAQARFERAPHPRFAFVGVGDTDEHAHAGNYAAYLDAIRGADAMLGDLLRIVDGWGPDEAASVVWLVTADHGRGPNFRDHGRSARGSEASWLVASGGPVPALGALGATDDHHLADLAPTVRALAGLPPVAGDDRGRPIAEIVLGAERALGRRLDAIEAP
jgi:hypothetical protein